MKAADVMSRHVVTLSADNSVAHAAQIMLDQSVSALPVVDGEGVLVGIITEGDLIRRVEFSHRPANGLSLDERYEAIVRANSWCVRDVMTVPVVTLDEEASVEDIARLLDTRGIKQVPIMRDGQIVGVVSRGSLLGIIARSRPTAISSGDEALRISIVARLAETLPMARLPTVTVNRGFVCLSGTTRSELEHRAIRVVVDGVPGSAGVDDQLRIERPGEDDQPAQRSDEPT